MNEDTTETRAADSPGRISPPVWFWIISVVALLWYLMDMSAFFMRVLMAEEMIASMPGNQQHLYRDMPLWVNIVFACEVFGGTLGCISMLLRKKWKMGVAFVYYFTSWCACPDIEHLVPHGRD